MSTGERHPLVSGTVVTSLGTLASRILGLVRDTATAALFGLAAGGVLDALVIAFRIPNLFRALFGEGALTASYLPIFTQARQEHHEQGWQLFRATLKGLAILLALVTLLVEVGIGVWAWLAKDDPQALLLAGLSAVLLPYLILVCLTAIISATLQGLGRFAAPAFAPAALNVCWILGAWWIAPHASSNPVTQGYVLAGCILLGGVVQWLVQWPALRQAGFKIRKRDLPQKEQVRTQARVADHLRHIRLGMIPTTLALTVTQLNTLSDSLVAWILAAPKDGPYTISWLGNVRYPMQQGAAAAIYFGERLYQFPLGLIGIAAATVAFPLLSQHAARGDRAALAEDLTLGLRMVLLAAVPSAVGLVVLAEPIARLLFQHGRFTADDAVRAAGMIAVYGAGVWAYCALPVLVRSFYAVGDRITPLRVALAAVVLNLALDFTLIWPLAEEGLAAATAISAALQAVALALLFSKHHVPLAWRKLTFTALRACAASAAMGAAGALLLHALPLSDGDWNACLRAVAPVVAAVAVYGGVLALVGRSEWADFFGRK
ncbi:MAG TPA: murein biosynthesis integral membrane protein MurJ [Pirellulales bacterium]|jgi:putative peptidoglycan lipid II flippase|nr:murein biosynthesis integral membrane protein MurJ [Pirellulales bacterium]